MNIKREEWDAVCKERKELSAEIINLRNNLTTAQNEIEKLRSSLESHKTNGEYNSKRASDAEHELEEIGTVLDMVDSPPPRKTGTDSMESYQRHDLSVLSRLTIWLAKRMK